MRPDVIPRVGKVVANDEESYRYLVESIRRFPRPEAFRRMIADGRLRSRRGGSDAWRSCDHSFGLEDLTSSVTHLWRLVKWGRTLARHGALRGIEEDPLHAAARPQADLRCIARFGARAPPTPRLCDSAGRDRPGGDQARPGAVDASGSGRRKRRRKPVAAAGRPAARAIRKDQANHRDVLRCAAREPVRGV